MKSVWTWSGQHFGAWDGDDLWTHHGKHVGRRRGADIYAPTGLYIGELMGNGRLKVNKAKAAERGLAFVPSPVREKSPPQRPLEGLPLYRGYEDFPHPDLF